MPLQIVERGMMDQCCSRRGLSRAAVVLTVVACAGIIVGALIHMLSGNGEMVQRTKSATQMRAIALAAYTKVKSEQDGLLDFSFDILIGEEYLTESMLDSPLGDVSDGRGDYWAYPNPVDMDGTDVPAQLIILYDRAAYETCDRIPVCFLNGRCGHVELVEFEALIATPPNGGVDYDLPVRGR